MLNREEYNLAFKTTLSQEEFDEIMGKPVTDLSEVEELVIADRKGNVWRFLPKANAIPIEWIKKYIAEEGIYPNRELLSVEQAEALERMIENWEKENE